MKFVYEMDSKDNVINELVLLSRAIHDIADKAIEERDFFKYEFERLRKETLELQVGLNFKNNLPVIELVLFGLNVF